MRILSIETSCDDTCVTIFEAKGNIQNASFQILANNSNSQINIHREYGGVYPMLAKREHIKNLPILLEKTLRESGLSKKKKPVDLIAITYGPGLEPCLWTGITFAQDLAKKWNVPIVPVNHMEGHILSAFGKNNGKFKIPKVKTPILSLLVSGGHTELVLTKTWTTKNIKHKIIGRTLDDAAGEAFDKVARMLGLPYPGGPEISKLAEQERGKQEGEEKQSLRGISQVGEPRGSAPRARGDSDPEKISFSVILPRPMKHSKNLDFSFSGLKTAVLYLIQKIGKLDKETKSKIALEFENAVIETLVYKTKKAVEKYNVKTVIVAGGVAANKYLRNEMKRVVGKDVKLLFPGKGLSTDNSVMIGMAGYLQYLKRSGKLSNPSKIKADGNLKLK